MAIKLYALGRGGDGFVVWKGPDGDTHSLDADNPPNPADSWAIVQDSQNRPVMAYSPSAFGSDGTLYVSIEGAPSRAATLLHDEDDAPRKLYYATDNGNGTENPLGRPAFILRGEGMRDCPVQWCQTTK
jgi:hypothetical protein